jgi:hypothetical protein
MPEPGCSGTQNEGDSVMTEEIADLIATLYKLADVSTGELRQQLEFAAGFIRMYSDEAADAWDDQDV